MMSNITQKEHRRLMEILNDLIDIIVYIRKEI